MSNPARRFSQGCGPDDEEDGQSPHPVHGMLQPPGQPPFLPPGHHPPPLVGPPGGLPLLAHHQPMPGFFQPAAAFGGNLAAAIAAAEYQQRADAAAAAQVFAAAQAHVNAGMGHQPFLQGFPGFMPQSPMGGAAFMGGMGLGGLGGGGVPPPPPSSSQSPIPNNNSPVKAAGTTNNNEDGVPAASPKRIRPEDASTNLPDVVHTATAGDGTGGCGDGSSGPLSPKLPMFSNGRPELPPPKWYDSDVPLGVAEDRYYLSELQCVLRSEFVEAFGTTQVSC